MVRKILGVLIVASSILIGLILAFAGVEPFILNNIGKTATATVTGFKEKRTYSGRRRNTHRTTEHAVYSFKTPDGTDIFGEFHKYSLELEGNAIETGSQIQVKYIDFFPYINLPVRNDNYSDSIVSIVCSVPFLFFGYTILRGVYFPKNKNIPHRDTETS